MIEKLKRQWERFSVGIAQDHKVPNAPNDHSLLVILDIGCRWGFAERFESALSSFRIFGFDPDEAECDRLRERYQGKPVEIVPLALAGKPGTRALFITEEPACSSLLKPDPTLTTTYPALGCAREQHQSTIETTTLDHWARSAGLQGADYIKVDTQGSELEILKGGKKVLQSVRALEVEVEFNPIYQNQPLFSDVDLFLRKQGFMLWKYSNLVHYSRYPERKKPLFDDVICYDDDGRVHYQASGGQLFWANAHYVRKTVLTEVNAAQRQRDELLFPAIGMADVLDCRATPSRN